jgi:parallel beta-helix repeat protein
MIWYFNVHYVTRFALLAITSTCGLWALDVRQYGAIGNGMNDDTLAIQNAVNGCPYMGTVTFPAGNFPVSGITLKSQCTYAGMGRSNLTLNSPNRFILDMSERSDIHITGLVLDSNVIGGGILAQGFAPARNIQIDNCEFRNVSAAAIFPANLAMVSTWGIVDSTIQRNRFNNVSGGIWFTTVGNLNILNNSFVDITQGDAIYIAPNPASFPNGDNLRIVGNSGTNMARIGIEIFRPDPSNGSVLNAPVIDNNSFSNWTGADGMGLSITHGDGALIRGNRLSNVNGPTQYTGIEVIVANAQLLDNNITGGFTFGITVAGMPSPNITGNHITNVTETGIILACDRGRNRCASTNSIISGNTIVNARLMGIKLDNDWSGSVISRNTVTRTAGFWPDDSSIFFAGVHQSPAPGIGVIDSNTTVMDSTTWPWGFWFGGVRLNSPMPGSSITNNVVRSLTATPLGSGVLDNTGFARNGWNISGNTYINTAHDVN